ncbi:MAG: hypothetical protein B0A82_08910 [Alkalinema sp. CACIAM 70d]|nr:MAG: hypothetical protein B0A82_08910 [Alkalinema sp. CACIAM 70d]
MTDRATQGRDDNLWYEDRVVAFVDILGFGALVIKADKDPDFRRQIYEALRNVSVFKVPTILGTHFKAQNFSDSLIISAANTAEGLWHVLFSLSDLTINLLEIGVLVRGGVTIGGIHHDDDVVFGAGVNDAYRLESTIAKSPRIILSARALRAAEAYAADKEEWKVYRDSRLRRDKDGVWFLNFFCELGSFSRQGGWQKDGLLYQRGMTIFDNIQGLVSETVDQPNIYEKLGWLGDYWNNEVGRGFAKYVQPILPPVVLAGHEVPRQTWSIAGGISPGVDGLED